MADQTPTVPAAAPEDPKSRITVLVDHAKEHHYKYVYIVLLALGLVGTGYYWGTRQCTGMSETERRQLRDELTEKERKIQEADLKIGKVETKLTTAEQIKTELETRNSDLAKTADDLARKYGLKVDQYSQLKAKFDAVIKGGVSGVLPPELVASKTPECGACKGAVAFGTPAYATCTWADYAALKDGKGGGTLGLHMGVRIDQVTLKQDPKDGTLKASVGKVYMVDGGNAILAEAVLDPASKVWTAPAGLGDLNRRHLWATGGISRRDYKLGFLTQKGVKPFIWGGNLTKDFNAAGGLGIEAILGWQLR